MAPSRSRSNVRASSNAPTALHPLARRARPIATTGSRAGRVIPIGVRGDDRVERERYQALLSLAVAAEREKRAAGHAEQVALTAFAIARRLGLPRAEAELIYEAAPLHDIGKIALPTSLLSKPGKLSAAEFEQVKRHTTAGAALLASSESPVLQLAGEIVLTHHEHWDGSGYPAGLRGEEIPLSGRIVALADVFDALIHSRPYKRAWTVERAVAELKRLRGRQFDPQVLDCFLELDPSGYVEPATRSLSIAAALQ